MRVLTWFVFLVLLAPNKAVCQDGTVASVSQPDVRLLSPLISQAAASVDSMIGVLKRADQSYATKTLFSLVAYCAIHFSKSDTISKLLTDWLREDQPFYAGKSATDVRQFRGFLMYSLGKFVPNAELYQYIKYELAFADYVFNIAAAAATAKNFPREAETLIQLMTRYTGSSFIDDWVDITTPDLNYPLLHPTKARYEIIHTLKSFGADAYPALDLLKQMSSPKLKRAYNNDTALSVLAAQAAADIEEATPSCCRKETNSNAARPGAIKLISKSERKKIHAPELQLLDQEGNAKTFAALTGKPFVLTFFYTSCVNPLKCAATVDRLGRLQKELTEQRLISKVGIYGMTYDPDVDRPDVLKKYGTFYGMTFAGNVNFLLADNNSDKAFVQTLNLRVNHGYGSVNLHGTQLYIFDKKGRLAAACDNETWLVDAVKDCLVLLLKE